MKSSSLQLFNGFRSSKQLIFGVNPRGFIVYSHDSEFYFMLRRFRRVNGIRINIGWVQYLTAALCLVVVVFSCVLVFFLLKRNILKKAVDIGLLKIIGYEDKAEKV